MSEHVQTCEDSHQRPFKMKAKYENSSLTLSSEKRGSYQLI